MMSANSVIKVLPHIKGLIFDCDGTLVDSMPLHMKAWEYAITKAGAVWNYEFFYSKKGMESEDIVIAYNKQFGTALEPRDTVRVKHEFFERHGSEFKPIEPVIEVVHRFKGILPMAVASGGNRENVHAELNAIGVNGLFKAIVTADDNVIPKPDPGIFLEAAARIGVPQNLCQVFEDGDLGLEAARKAGMVATDIRLFLDHPV
ncbi:MAG: HAD-IA family hydrolase [Bacteroidota bacterium]